MICPNLSDPAIRRDFNELKTALGEPIAYYIWDKNKGYHVDKNSDGTPSELFEELEKNLGDRNRAIKSIALTFSNKYKNFKPVEKETTIEKEIVESLEPSSQEQIKKKKGKAKKEATKKTITAVFTKIDQVLEEVGEPVVSEVEKTPEEVATEIVSNPEQAIESVISQTIEQEVTTEEARAELENVYKGKSELTKKIKELIKSGTQKALLAAAKTKGVLGRVLSKVLSKLRKALLILAVTGTSAGTLLSFSPKNLNFSLNNLVDNSTEVLPDDWKQSATRQFVKWGMYDVSNREATVEYKETKQKAPVKDTVTEFTEVVGTVKDELSSNPTDSLVMIRNQFDNAKGFTYLAGPIKSRTPQGYSVPNSVGVAHFLILDDQGVDLSEFTSDTELKAASDLFKKKIGQDIKLTDYIPTFVRNENGVTLKYKKASEVTAQDIVLTKMINYNFSNINFKANKSAASFGFRNNIRAIANENDEALASFLFTAAGKNKYSRFSGASVVFIFQDKFGNTVVRDFTGSLEMVEKEGNAIAQQYNISPKDITLGVYDAGSYTGKPKANIKGELKASQYVGYNTLHKNSAGALIIPRSTPSPNKGLMLLPLIALVSRARRRNQPIYQQDLDRIKEERTKILETLGEVKVSSEYEKLSQFVQAGSVNGIDKLVNVYFKAAANKQFPNYLKQVTEEQKKAIRNEVSQQRKERKNRELDPKKEAQALLWFKSTIGEHILLKNFSRVLNQYGFAHWTKNAITLHKASVYSDLYHEAWHEFTQMYLTQAERDALYEEVKNKIGDYKGMPFSLMTRKEIEEYLAEGFRDFAYNYKEEPAPEPTSFRDTIYNKILKFLNWLLNKESKIKPESKDLIKEAYKKLYTGNYEMSVVGEAEFDKLYSGSILGDYQPVETVTWPEETQERIASGNLTNFSVPLTETQLQDGVYQLSNGTTIRLFSKISENKRNYNVDIISTYEIESHVGREIFKAFDYFFFAALRNRPTKTTVADLLGPQAAEIQKEVYAYIQTNMNVLYEEMKENYLKKLEKDSGLESIEKDQFLNMFVVLNNFDSVKNMHWIELAKTLGEFKDDVYEIEGESRNRENWDLDIADINPIDNSDPLIYTLIKGLPSYIEFSEDRLVNRGVYTGLPQTGDFNRNWNILLDTLLGSSSYDVMIERIKKLSKNFPQFSILVEQLPNSIAEAVTIEDLRIVAALKQSIGVEFVPYGLAVRQAQNEKGEPGFQTNVHVLSTTAAYKIQNYLDTDFEHNQGRGYRKLVKQEYALDLRQALTDFSPTFNALIAGQTNLNIPTMFDFFKDVFGMDLTPLKDEVRVQGLVNRVGKELFKRMYFISKEAPNEGVRRPLALLGKQYKNEFLAEKESKYLPSTKLDKEKKKQDVFFKAVGFIKNFKNELDELYKFYDNYYKVFGDKAFLNQERNLQYSAVPYNEIFYLVEKVNNANTKDELAADDHAAPIVTSTFSKYSYWINKKLFTADGKKKKDSLQNSAKLFYINWGGPTVLKERATTGKGKKSSNLTNQEKFINDFLSFHTGRMVENLRFGEKNTSMALYFSGGKADTVSFPEEDLMTEEGTYLGLDLESQMLEYLAYELEMFFKNPESGKPTFIIFSELISKELKDRLIEKVGALYDPNIGLTKGGIGRINKARQVIFSTERDAIISQVSDFFQKEVKSELGNLAFAILPNPTSLSEQETMQALTKIIAQALGEPAINNQAMLERKMLYYITNYFVHQIELTHNFIANPRNYQKTKNNNYREAFKRFGLTSSPARQPRLERAWVNNYNTLKARDLELMASKFTGAAEREDLGRYTNKLRLSVVEDIHTNKNNKDSVIAYYKYQIIQEREVLGKPKLTEKELNKLVNKRYKDYTEQTKEADAQAWSNLDFMRMYLDSIRRWTPAHEAAYEFEKELLRKFLGYKAEKDINKKAALLAEVNKMRYEANFAQFPSLKLGLYGSAIGFPDSKTAGKFSVHTLLPSVVIGTDLEDVLMNMLTDRIDLVTFQSGSKLDFPAEVGKLYDTSKPQMSINRLEEKNIATFSIESLREQQYIAPKFKGESTLGTQYVKLLFGDFYDGGEFSEDFPAELKPLIEEAQASFIDNLNKLINVEKENLAYEAGATLVDGRVTDVNKEVFFKWLQKQGEKRDTYEDFISFARNAYSYDLGLDSIGFRNFVESILTSSINKRVITPKISGEQYIQTASTGYSKLRKRFSNASVEDLLEYGTNGLREYRIENGVVQPADCKIAFNPKKHEGLLKLQWNGEQIGNIENLNRALLDDEWVNQNSDKLVLIGVRIPTTGFNLMEYLRVREFLPESAGSIMIVHPSIVTKAGSDFDIDKLYMYAPNIDSETGELINSPVISKAAHQKELDYYYDQIKEINSQLDIVSAELLSLPEYQTKQELKAKLEELKFSEPKVDLSKLKGKTIKLEELQSQNDVKQQITDILRKIAKIKEGSENMLGLYEQIEELKKLKSEWYSSRDLAKDEVKNGIATLYNNIISTSIKVLEQPAIYEALSKPNNNDILIPTIEKFYTKFGKSIEAPIRGTNMYLPSASTTIHGDTLEAKKPLGIVAKMNALHKLYQQTGLKWESDLYNAYYLEGQRKGGKLILGAKYSKLPMDGRKVLVSDLLTQFVNGHVDIGNADWINRIRSDKQRSPLYMQMLIQGTSIESSIIFLMQPVMNEYFAKTRDNLFKKILFPKDMAKKKEVIYADMLNSLVKVIDPSLGGQNVEETVLNILSPVGEYVGLLGNITFDRAFESYPPSVRGIQEKEYSKALREKNIPYLKTQLAFFAQLYVIEKQNEALVKLNQNVDFNTMKYGTLQSIYNNYKFLTEGEVDGVSIFEIFEPQSLNRVIKESILSPFSVSDFGVELYSTFLEITGHPAYLKALHKHYVEEEKDVYGEEFLSRYVNKFTNDFILSIFQNTRVEDLEATYFEAYPKDLFKANNLPALFQSFKNSKNPEMVKLFQTNNFLRYFNFRQVPDTEYYSPVISVGNASKESKDDFTSQLLSLRDAKFSDLELEEEFQNFIYNLTRGTLIQKGFITKLNTIQPFISYQFFSDLLNDALVQFQNTLNNPQAFSKYFDKFVEQFDAVNRINFNSVADFKSYPIAGGVEVESLLAEKEPIKPLVKTYKYKKNPTKKDLKRNQIWVFGSNLGKSTGGVTAHGAGAAKIAVEQFGAKPGQARGRQGRSFGIVTKKFWDVVKSSTKQDIISEIKGLYEYALANPLNEFIISYSGKVKTKMNLSGYTNQELAEMFSAYPIPANIMFEEEFSELLILPYAKDTLASPLLQNAISYQEGPTFLESRMPADNPQYPGMPEFNKLPAKSKTPTMVYAGVGSRKITTEGAARMKKAVEILNAEGYKANTGDASGADAIVRENANGLTIFTAKDATTRTRKIAKEIHPDWNALVEGAKKKAKKAGKDSEKAASYVIDLMARNTNQVFGKSLKTPVDFLLVWTSDGITSYEDRSVDTGGTGQAIELASRKNIPVINLLNDNWEEELRETIDSNKNQKDKPCIIPKI